MKLRELKISDAEGMLSWMHDDSVNKNFHADFAHFTKEKVIAFIENSGKDLNSVNYACVDGNDEYLGTVSLKNIDREAGNAEYAISFRKEAHGTGASVFATKEILRIAFEEMGLERVYLNVIPENERANAFYKKVGFIYEGTFKRHIMIGGTLRDLNWYRMLKEEYFADNNK